MPKFDVVVGNPPFQKGDGNRGNPLWPRFSKISINMVKDGGYAVFLTPATWVNGNGIFKDIFKKNNPLLFNINECKKHFISGNNTFSYWLVQKGQYKENTTIISRGIDKDVEITNINLNDFSYLPSGWVPYTHEVLSIHKKLCAYEKLPIISGVPTSYKLSRFSSIKDKNHPYKIIYSKARTIYSSQPEFLQDKLKVIIWNTAQYLNNCEDDTNIVTDAIGRQVSCILVPKNIDPKIIKNTLSGKFYTFCDIINRGGAYFGGSNFPNIDLTKEWTDAQLYKHFNLTQQEIDYIESQVK